jgi:arginine metabolism regulation protein II
VSGEVEDFAVHLHGTVQLRNSRRRWKIIGDSTRQLNEISAFLTLLARTLSFKTPPSYWVGNVGDISYSEDSVAEAIPSGRCYVYMYGITRNIAAAIQETCRLSELLNQLDSNQRQNSDLILFEECETLGDRLLAWSLDSENSASTLAGDDIMSAIFEHHAKAWHCAALIYYYHRIQHYDAENLLDLVDCVTEHMHTIEDMKTDIVCETTKKMAPITWPMFIASCVSVKSMREPCERWWERVQHYRIANLRRQWDVLQMIWERGDGMGQANSGSSNWIDIYCDLGVNLMPI